MRTKTSGVKSNESQWLRPALWRTKVRDSASIFRSSSLTEGCCRGSSLNQRRKMANQATPKAAKTTKVHLQPNSVTPASTSGGVAAPPQRVHAHIRDCADTRSRAGSHTLSMRVRLGKQPASPAPKRKRMTHSEATFQAAPVSAVKKDHAATI